MIRRFGLILTPRAGAVFMKRGMMNSRRVLTAIVAVASLVALSPSVVAQQNNQQNRREQERRSQADQRDIQALVKLVEAVAAGKQPAPADIPVAWAGNHFVRGAEGATFIPFTLAIDAGKVA